MIKGSDLVPDLPIISIVMVSFNQSSMIENSILSVLSQSYANIEFIIVDGKSTDGSLRIIDKYASRIKVVVSESDNGMYHARNKGILLSSGDYIGFLNSDDLYYPDAISDIASFIIQENFPDMVFGYTIGLDREGNELKKVIFGRDVELNRRKYFRRMKTIPDQSCFYRRDSLAFIGMFDTTLRFSADTDLRCRFIVRAMKISIFPKIIAAWRIYEETLTFRPDLRTVRFKEAVMVNHRYTGYFLNYYNTRLFAYNYIVPVVKKLLGLS